SSPAFIELVDPSGDPADNTKDRRPTMPTHPEQIMRTTWTFYSAGQFLFGRNAVDQLGEVAGRLEAERLLIVTDRILAKATPLDRVRAPLTQTAIQLEAFD